MATQRTRRWPFYLIVGAILLALPAGYFYFLGDEVAPPAPTAAPKVAAPEPESAVELKLSELQGEVEVRRANGEWTKANVGQALSTADTVRTLDGAYAVLVGGEAYEIRMEPGTEVSVSELTHSISRLLLGRGMAQAKVKAGAQHTFEVRAAGSDATARTTGGSFAISNNGAGTVAVGTQDGEVEFFGSGKTVIVRAGQQSIVRPGRGPTEPTAIPSSLLLKVKWPTERELRRKTLVVSGEAEPGTQVTIAGRTAAVGADGRFAHKLELAEGKNPIEIRARSVGGLSEQQQRDVTVDTTPPRVGVDPNLWK